MISQSNKERVVSLSRMETEYRAMTYTSSKILWVLSLLTDLGFSVLDPMPMFCDNQATIFITNDPTFHE